MNIIVLILLIIFGVLTQTAAHAARNFRGSSSHVFMALQIMGNFGVLFFFVLIIWAFFIFHWWVPVIALLVPFMFMGVIPVFSETIIGRLSCVFLTPLLLLVLIILFLE